MKKINEDKMQTNKVLVLPDIRSALNVGAIFRTSDAVGINKIYLTGYTPTPIDKFGRARNDIAKSALGAEKVIPWEYKKSLSRLISNLKKEKYKIVAIEQDKKAMDYKKIPLSSKMVFIVGNETEGLKKNILEKCDYVAEIPMAGMKESLNVSVATGVALFRILNK